MLILGDRVFVVSGKAHIGTLLMCRLIIHEVAGWLVDVMTLPNPIVSTVATNASLTSHSLF